MFCNSKVEEVVEMKELEKVISIPQGDKRGFLRDKKKIKIVGLTAVAVILIAIAVLASSFWPAVVIDPSTDSIFTFNENRFDNSNKTSKKENGEKISVLSNTTIAIFSGKWRLDRQKNLDEYLKIIGISYYVRLVAPSVKSEMDIKVNGQNEIIIRGTGFTKSKSVHFNVQSKETTADGRNVMTIHTFEKGQWIEIERWNETAKEKCAKYVREVLNGEFIETINVDYVTSSRTYVKQS